MDEKWIHRIGVLDDRRRRKGAGRKQEGLVKEAETREDHTEGRDSGGPYRRPSLREGGLEFTMGDSQEVHTTMSAYTSTRTLSSSLRSRWSLHVS
jgi:hypothetical protein